MLKVRFNKLVPIFTDFYFFLFLSVIFKMFELLTFPKKCIIDENTNLWKEKVKLKN